MKTNPLARAIGFLATAATVAWAPGALAQNVQVVVPTLSPVANAATQGLPSSVYVDVTNKGSAALSGIWFTLPSRVRVGNQWKYWTAQGGAGPAGWTASAANNGGSTSWVGFQVASCPGGIAPNATARFRIDLTSPARAYSTDQTISLGQIYPYDACGNASFNANRPGFPLKMLAISGAALPPSGASPLAATATFTVVNETAASKPGVSLSGLAATPSSGATLSGCTPATATLAAGASGAFTCGYTLASSGGTTSYTIFASATDGAGSSAAGAVAGPVLVGSVVATFAFDTLAAVAGDTVHATLAVANYTAGAIGVTPPTYAQLGLTNLAQAAGTTDPAPAASVAPGATVTFVYSLTVSATAPVGASYVAQGTASTTAGSSNLAVTPAGTVSAFRVTWAPGFVVKARSSAYQFTATVTNTSSANVGEIDVVNPQNSTWTGLAEVAISGMTGPSCSVATSSPTGSAALQCTGTLAPGATATITFGFGSIPADTSTTLYPFQVLVYPANTGFPIYTSYPFTVANTVPIVDVAQVSIQSTAAGQTLYWVNTSGTANGADPLEAHDGVAIFRTPAGTVPPSPADGTDYTVTPGAIYADKAGSQATTFSDPTPGAYDYRVCNHDANFVYSSCSSGFWNNAGWLDSVVAPAGGWAHAFGGAIYYRPGVLPGNSVGVAHNGPALAVVAASTGARSFPPAALGGLPSGAALALPLSNGKNVLYAADQSGTITAVDLASGATYWQQAKAGESFVAGMNAVLRQYASAAFQAAYPTDVLLLGSTTGHLLALDATTGATLWTVTAPAAIRAMGYYDYAGNRLYVPTYGSGLVAYDIGLSSPSTPAPVAAGWASPARTYTLGCTPTSATGQIACADTSGAVRTLDASTGAETASLASGLSSPSSLWSVAGTTPGLVVSNASSVQRLNVAGTSMTLAGSWSPGLTLSPLLVLQGAGTIYVSASDLKVHKLALANAADTGLSVGVTPQAAGALLAPPAYDVVDDLILLGSTDGHLWAVPHF